MNLEDIAAPRCFEIERKLKESCDIPIFHDDQHGTAVITLAGLTNALKVVGKSWRTSASSSTGRGPPASPSPGCCFPPGLKDITLCDRRGAIYKGRDEGMNPIKEEMAQVTNPEKRQGTLADVLKGADVFIGVSAPGAVTTDMVKTMNKDAIIFACANPTPEIFPDEARAGGAAVIATGRSDFPNQINNVLAFPGIFRGALDVRARDINDAMKIAAAYALAGLICRGRALRRLYHPHRLRPPGGQGRGRRRGPGRPGHRRGPDLSPRHVLKRAPAAHGRPGLFMSLRIPPGEPPSPLRCGPPPGTTGRSRPAPPGGQSRRRYERPPPSPAPGRWRRLPCPPPGG